MNSTTCPCGDAILADTEDCKTPLCYNCTVSVAENFTDWRPIGTAPKDGSCVLFYDQDTGLRIIGGYYSFRGGDKTWRNDSCPSETHNPTYWMPLPEKPEY